MSDESERKGNAKKENEKKDKIASNTRRDFRVFRVSIQNFYTTEKFTQHSTCSKTQHKNKIKYLRKKINLMICYLFQVILYIFYRHLIFFCIYVWIQSEALKLFHTNPNRIRNGRYQILSFSVRRDCIRECGIIFRQSKGKEKLIP